MSVRRKDSFGLNVVSEAGSEAGLPLNTMGASTTSLYRPDCSITRIDARPEAVAVECERASRPPHVIPRSRPRPYDQPYIARAPS